MPGSPTRYPWSVTPCVHLDLDLHAGIGESAHEHGSGGPGRAEALAEHRPARLTTAPQISALHDRAIDVGLLREPSADAALDFKVVLTEPFVAVLPSGHPLASLRRVPLAQLADAHFVLLPRHVGPGLYDQILGLCAAAGFTPSVAQYAVEWQTVCGLVEAGLGVSLAPESIRRVRLSGVAFRSIDPSAARTRVAAAWRKNGRNPLIAHLLAAVG